MDRMAEKIEFIAEHNGLEKVLDKLAEECAEYTAARLQHHERGTEDWIGELADVMICIRQIEFHAERNLVLKAKLEEEIKRKTDRQVRRIRGEET